MFSCRTCSTLLFRFFVLEYILFLSQLNSPFYSSAFVLPLSHLDRQQKAPACDVIMNCSLRSLFALFWKQSGASHWANNDSSFFRSCSLQVRQQGPNGLMKQFDTRKSHAWSDDFNIKQRAVQEGIGLKHWWLSLKIALTLCVGIYILFRYPSSYY